MQYSADVPRVEPMEVAYENIRLVPDVDISQSMFSLILEDKLAAWSIFGYREDFNTLYSQERETHAIIKDIFGDVS